MKISQPLISVIIPAYNAEKYIAEALRCVIDQQYNPLEIIVVDDGSTDSTADFVKGFGKSILYTYQENRGPSAARNTGLRLAKGSFIAYLDADDLWPRQYFDMQLERFRDYPTAEIVLGNTQQIQLSVINGEEVFYPFLEPKLMLSMGGAFIRRTAFEKVGFFDEALLFCEDMDWFLRARELDLEMIFHQEIAHIYRKHTHNITHQQQQLEKFQLLVYKKSLDRRRRAGIKSDHDFLQWTEYYEIKK